MDALKNIESFNVLAEKYNLFNPAPIKMERVKDGASFHDVRNAPITLPMQCLLVQGDWVRGIMSGRKGGEVRNGISYPIGEWVAIVETKTDFCFGAVKFTHSASIDNSQEWAMFRQWHCVENDFGDVKYKKPCIWFVGDLWRFRYPLKIKRKKGQVVWVKNPEIAEIYNGKNGLQMLQEFYADCEVWGERAHYLK